MQEKNREKLISIQPYFVMEADDFCQHVLIENGISHFFSFSNKSAQDITVPLLVDGCSNLIFEYRNETVRTHLIGITVEKRTFSVKANAEYFGVRLQPSFTKFVREYQPKDIIGKIVILDDLPSTRDFCKIMGVQKDFNSRMYTFLQEYSKFQSKGRDDTKADLFIQRKGMVRVSELEDLAGYSSRYINKIFEKELGLSAKQLCSTVKFQFLLSDLNKGTSESFTSIASEYNFYDQVSYLPPYIKGYTDAVISAQERVFGVDFFYRGIHIQSETY